MLLGTFKKAMTMIKLVGSDLNYFYDQDVNSYKLFLSNLFKNDLWSQWLRSGLSKRGV